MHGKGRPKGSLNLEAAGGRNGHAERAVSTRYRGIRRTQRGHKAAAVHSAGGSPKYEDEGYGAADVTKRGLEYLQANGDSYEPGTAMPRAYQRAVRRTPDSDDELTGPGETQGTIRCATQPMPIPSIRQGGEDIEDEDDPLADFNEMDRQVDEEESVQQELCAEGLL
ncbi:hypothetical protein HRG_012191 [Hirsutella rhossiliensis]